MASSEHAIEEKEEVVEEGVYRFDMLREDIRKSFMLYITSSARLKKVANSYTRSKSSLITRALSSLQEEHGKELSSRQFSKCKQDMQLALSPNAFRGRSRGLNRLLAAFGCDGERSPRNLYQLLINTDLGGALSNILHGTDRARRHLANFLKLRHRCDLKHHAMIIGHEDLQLQPEEEPLIGAIRSFQLENLDEQVLIEKVESFIREPTNLGESIELLGLVNEKLGSAVVVGQHSPLETLRRCVQSCPLVIKGLATRPEVLSTEELKTFGLRMESVHNEVLSVDSREKSKSSSCDPAPSTTNSPPPQGGSDVDSGYESEARAGVI